MVSSLLIPSETTIPVRREIGVDLHVTKTRTRVIVSGRVQGVWFRESTRRMAEKIGVSGWVRNLGSGDVEAVFEGTEAAVAAAVEWARTGPEHAVVTSIEAFAEQPEGLEGFAIRG